MQVKLILSLLLSTCFSLFQAQTSLNRASFYKIISAQDLKNIDSQLQYLDKIQGVDAFKGALLMKKSGLVNGAGNQLKLFKEGNKALESAISSDSTNTEYRFLRILIQENAPKIVRYSSDIKKDASYLRKHYKTLPAVVQQAVFNYSKGSKELKPEDFKNVGYE